jgi:N-acetyl sugar amidotransferase
MPSTRPRITFNESGVCNACQWAEEKRKTVDWKVRWEELEKYCDQYRSKDGNFDVIIPVSGGKDSCYVTLRMAHDLGMHPLLVNIGPPLTFEVGNNNLDKLIAGGFDCIRVYPNPHITMKISKRELIDFGDPLLGWMISVRSSVYKVAIKFNVPFIMWGEDGDVEYGGSTETKNKPFPDLEYQIKINLSGNDPKKYLNEYSGKELNFWLLPSAEEFKKAQIRDMYFGYFVCWDQYENYVLSKEKLGFEEKIGRNVGTYTNFAQTDTSIFDLHCHLMYLKFGFGRCTADACIDVRRGALDRDQAVELIKKFDNAYPEPYIDQYLEYFDMTQEEFDAALAKHANENLFEKVNGRWNPTFQIK